MTEITILETRNRLPDSEHGNDASRVRRSVVAAGRFVRTVGKILGSLALGVGLAIGGYCIAASSSSILTSSDKALLQLIAVEPAADARRDPFATERAAPEKPPTPEEAVYWKRSEALVTFGMGLIVCVASLLGFGLAYGETADAFDAIRRRSGRQ